MFFTKTIPKKTTEGGFTDGVPGHGHGVDRQFGSGDLLAHNKVKASAERPVLQGNYRRD